MSQYSRGADFERSVIKHLEQQGYLAFRCAGSKGNSKVDIIAVPPIIDDIVKIRKEDIQLIQCKISGIASQFEKEQLKQAAERFGCIPILTSKENRKIKFEVL